jgi:hypothetical protein
LSDNWGKNWSILKLHQLFVDFKKVYDSVWRVYSSKMENKAFTGFTSIDINYGISWKFRISKIASIFTP